MHGSSIFTWVWVIVVLAGIINSIRKKAAVSRPGALEAAAAAREAQAEDLRRRREAYLEQLARQRAAAEAAFVPPAPQPAPPEAPARPAPPPAAAKPAPPPRPRPPAAPVHPGIAARPAGVLDGLFEDPRSIVRAIVAAEVLGRPKALAEQTFWSPPHSAP